MSQVLKTHLLRDISSLKCLIFGTFRKNGTGGPKVICRGQGRCGSSSSGTVLRNAVGNMRNKLLYRLNSVQESLQEENPTKTNRQRRKPAIRSEAKWLSQGRQRPKREKYGMADRVSDRAEAQTRQVPELTKGSKREKGSGNRIILGTGQDNRRAAKNSEAEGSRGG